jgi:hypothetical protein
MTTTAYVFGFIGAGLMVASYPMHNMLPRRVVALAANPTRRWASGCCRT